MIIRCGIDGARDLLNDRFIAKKVLAEAFAGLMSQSLCVLSN
jgi:hypothetical protein